MNFSIIIPVYNGEIYINELIEMLLKIFNKNDQIIFIDDCSTDNTYNTLQSTVINKKIKNIEILRNKENKGVSHSRNRGILSADKEFIFFLDVDDLIPNNFKIKLEEYILLYPKVEIIRFNHNKAKYILKVDYKNKYDNLENNLIQSYALHSSCTQVFKRELLTGLMFEENITFGEDMLFSYELLKNSSNILLIPDTLYYYSSSDSSASNTLEINKVKKRIESIIIVYNQILFKENTFFEIMVWKKNKEISQQLLKIYMTNQIEYNELRLKYLSEYQKTKKMLTKDIFSIHSRYINNKIISDTIAKVYKVIKTRN